MTLANRYNLSDEETHDLYCRLCYDGLAWSAAKRGWAGADGQTGDDTHEHEPA